MIRVRGPASPYDPTYHLLLNAHKIRQIVARERPDVLEIHSPYMAAASALSVPRSAYGVRTFQWHSDFIDTYAGVLEDKVPWIPFARRATRPLWSLVRAIAKRCDATLVASRWQRDKLEAHGVARLLLRPFGIERDVFRPEARSFEARRELLALAGRDTRDDATAIVLAIGRFAIEKRWDIAIDAFLRMRERGGRDAILVVFGDGPERARMEARAAGSRFGKDVVFPGFVKGRETLARSLASADVMLHACPFETFGLSIAEAMACGLSPIVPDAGGAGEMHDPAAGESYAAGDTEACVVALERMLDRVAKDGEGVRAAAVAAAKRLPTVREQFAHQVALYDELLATRRR